MDYAHCDPFCSVCSEIFVDCDLSDEVTRIGSMEFTRSSAVLWSMLQRPPPPYSSTSARTPRTLLLELWTCAVPINSNVYRQVCAGAGESSGNYSKAWGVQGTILTLDTLRAGRLIIVEIHSPTKRILGQNKPTSRNRSNSLFRRAFESSVP